MKTWNLGNTTVRSPERIAAGLRVLKEFEGQSFDEDVQLAFYRSLLAYGVLTGDMTERDQAVSGRKWASAANQMGLAVALKSQPPLRITDAGNRFLMGEPLTTETWLRQLMKIELPPPLEASRRGQYAGFDIHPFHFVLRVVLALQELRLEGPTREEIALFLVTTIRDSEVDDTAAKCAAYRAAMLDLRGSVARRKYFATCAKSIAAELYAEEIDARCEDLRDICASVADYPPFLESADCVSRLKAVCAGGKGSETRASRRAVSRLRTLITEGAEWNALVEVVAENRLSSRARTFSDYADTTIRYCRMSGLFTMKSSKLVIAEDAQNLASAIGTGEISHAEAKRFGDWFWNADEPRLPVDDPAFLSEDLERLLAQSTSLAKQIGAVPQPQTSMPLLPLPELKLARASAAVDVAHLREEFFYRRQARCLPDILEVLGEVIDGNAYGTYRPAMLEWAVWRALLATNAIACPVAETRNFPVDSDVNPTNTARGGVADLVFRYDRHVLVVEVTLRTGDNQWSAEAEPVPRHVFDEMQKHAPMRTLGLFLAPKIGFNTANQFFNQALWSPEEESFVPVDIVPLTLKQFMLLVESHGTNFSPEKLLEILEACLMERAGCAHGPEWLGRIEFAMATGLPGQAASQ